MDEIKDLKQFFVKIGISSEVSAKYAVSCEKEAITLKMLMELDEQDLEKLSIVMGHRKMILNYARKETMEDLFTIQGYSKPTNYGDAMLLIGFLLAKLNVDEGILSVVYCRSVLEEFKKNFLLNYLPARTKKTAEVLREAYQKFYDNPVNAGSRHLRECLKINGTDFAENCLAMYKKASDLIHTVAQLYKKYNLDGIRKLLQDLPKSGEMERACLTAIVTLPSPSTAAVQGGPINVDIYYVN